MEAHTLNEANFCPQDKSTENDTIKITHFINEKIEFNATQDNVN